MLSSARIKFVGDAEPDLVLHLQPTATIDDVLLQIREQRAVPPRKHLRIICAGKEMYPGDPITACQRGGSVALHCMMTDGAPQRGHQRPSPDAQACAAAAEQPPVDWLDVVDPGTVLMWIFGSILALLWLLFVFYAHMFDRTSVVMLIMMSVAFLIPCFPSRFSWFSFMYPQSSDQPLGGGPAGPDQLASGHSTALQGGLWNGQPIGPGGIPPRPAARVRPPVS